MCRLNHVSTEIVIAVCLCMRQPAERNMQTEKINRIASLAHIINSTCHTAGPAIHFSFM